MSIVVLTRRQELRTFLQEKKSHLGQLSLGFVPTMGALHEGHGKLISLSASENEFTIVSIFVNPKQFGPNEDFAKYPRTFQNDLETAERYGATAVFAPTIEEMYPEHFLTEVSVPQISEILCGAYRPGHFKGVCTVVLLLMNIIQANNMYLGQKDFQQVQIIKKMTSDLAHPTKIIMVPTIRETDGLAFSSRNRYLKPEARQQATAIPKALAHIAKLYLSGERQVSKLNEVAIQELHKENLSPQYFEFRNVHNLLQKCDDQVFDDTVVAVAQHIVFEGLTTRLIDNIILSDNSAATQNLYDLVNKALS